jgi:glycosyltransferase involved in cell wall biosynthesis
MNRYSTPKVSVVIPNFNHAQFLRRRIDTVLAQRFQDFEVILLDDCSTDESRSILEKYATDPRVKLDFNEVNSGSTFRQWRKGLRLARGEYIWIAESDDYAAPHFLDRLVSVLDAEPEAAFAYCRSWRVSDDDRLDGFADGYLVDLDATRWTLDYCADGRKECRDYFTSFNIVPNASAVLFRKTIYERVGGIDETLRISGDWKLWANMALAGKIAYVSEPLNYYRFHDNSVRGRDPMHVETAKESLLVVRWIRDQIGIGDSIKKRALDSLSRLWVSPVLNPHVPLACRWRIFRYAAAIDPGAWRRLVWPAFCIWFWHPTLNITRPIRHPFGLRQKKKARRATDSHLIGKAS